MYYSVILSIMIKQVKMDSAVPANFQVKLASND